MSAPSPTIMMVCNTDGALAVFRAPLIARLVGAGWQVWTLSNRSRFFDAIEALGAHPLEADFARHSVAPLANLRLFAAIYRALRARRPFVVHTFTHKANALGMVAALLARTPRRFMTVTGLGTPFLRDDLKSRVARAALLVQYAIAARIAHRVFFQNPDDLERLARWRVVPRAKALITGGSGIELGRFAVPNPGEVASARARLLGRIGQEERGQFIFVLVARTVKEKGVMEFYDAATALTGRAGRFAFVHFGEAEQGAHAIPLERLGAPRYRGLVHFLGFDPDIRDTLRAASAVVLPSYREGMPRSLLEALALDKPIVTSDVPGCRETVRQGWNGILCPARSAQGLARAMAEIAEWPPGVSAGRSRALCEERFDVEKVIATTLEQYGAMP